MGMGYYVYMGSALRLRGKPSEGPSLREYIVDELGEAFFELPNEERTEARRDIWLPNKYRDYRSWSFDRNSDSPQIVVLDQDFNVEAELKQFEKAFEPEINKLREVLGPGNVEFLYFVGAYYM